MPPTTRRSTRSSGPAAGKQSTLSFKHKVTKAIKTGKEGYKSPARAKEYIPEASPSPPASPTRAKASKKAEPATPAVDDDIEDENAINEPEEEKVEVVKKTEDGDKTAEAAALSDKAIEKYWAGIEASREARAVHKKHGEGLSTGEKVLRYFDVSSQYGVRILSFLSAPSLTSIYLHHHPPLTPRPFTIQGGSVTFLGVPTC